MSSISIFVFSNISWYVIFSNLFPVGICSGTRVKNINLISIGLVLLSNIFLFSNNDLTNFSLLYLNVWFNPSSDFNLFSIIINVEVFFPSTDTIISGIPKGVATLVCALTITLSIHPILLC